MKKTSRIAFDLERLVPRIKKRMTRDNISASELAARVSIGERTIGRLLSGQRINDNTMKKVFSVLKIDPFSVHEIDSAFSVSPLEYGSYSYDEVQFYIGTFACVRIDFETGTIPSCTRLGIKYNDDKKILEFDEFGLDKQSRTWRKIHCGELYFGSATSLFHLLTVHEGSIRNYTFFRFRIGDPMQYGLCFTAATSRGPHVIPAVCPALIAKSSEDEIDEFASDVEQNSDTFISRLKVAQERFTIVRRLD